MKLFYGFSSVLLLFNNQFLTFKPISIVFKLKGLHSCYCVESKTKLMSPNSSSEIAMIMKCDKTGKLKQKYRNKNDMESFPNMSTLR